MGSFCRNVISSTQYLTTNEGEGSWKGLEFVVRINLGELVAAVWAKIDIGELVEAVEREKRKAEVQECTGEDISRRACRSRTCSKEVRCRRACRSASRAKWIQGMSSREVARERL